MQSVIAFAVATSVIVPIASTAIAPDEDGATACAAVGQLTPSSVTQAGVPGAVVGETVTFTHQVRVEQGQLYQNELLRPDGSTYWSTYLEMTGFEADFAMRPDSVSLGVAPGDSEDPLDDAVAVPLQLGTTPLADSFVLDTDTTAADRQVWRVLFPGDASQIATDTTGLGVLSHLVSPSHEIFVMAFDAVVSDGADVGAGSILRGAECYSALSWGATSSTTERSSADVAIVEPGAEIVKTAGLAYRYSPGSVAALKASVVVPRASDDGLRSFAPARDVVMIDEVPVGLTPVDHTGQPLSAAGVSAEGGTWDPASRTLTFAVGDIAVGSQVDIDYGLYVGHDTTPGDTLTGWASLTYSSLPGDGDPADQVVTGAARDSADVFILTPGPVVTKTSAAAKWGPGLDLPYEVTVVFPPRASFSNILFVDAAPHGVELIDAVVTCAGAADPSNCVVPTELDTVGTPADSQGGSQWGWYLDELPTDASERTYTFTYSARFLGQSTAFPWTPLSDKTNTFTVLHNTIDRLGGVVPVLNALPTFDGEATSSATVVFDKPAFDIDIWAELPDSTIADAGTTSWNYSLGEEATVTAEVTNTGTEPALNIVFTDTGPLVVDPDEVLVDVGAGFEPCSSLPAPACQPAGNSFTYTHPGPMAEGDTYRFRYDAEPADAGTVSKTFMVDRYDDPAGSTYDDPYEDTVVLAVPEPELSLELAVAEGESYRHGNTVGTPIRLRFDLTNTTSATASNVRVTPDLAAGFCFTSTPYTPGVTATPGQAWSLDEVLAGHGSFSFEADIVVCDTTAEPGTHLVGATVTWEDYGDGHNSAGTAYADTSETAVAVDVVEFEVGKTPSSADGAIMAQSGGGAWLIELENVGDTSIGGVVLRDALPETLEYLPGTATAIWLGGAPHTFQDVSTASGTTVTPNATGVLELVVDRLEPGRRVRFTVPLIQNGATPADGDLTLVSTVTAASGDVEASADGQYSLIPVNPGPSVIHTVTAEGAAGPDLADAGYPADYQTHPAAPGAVALFHLDVTIPGDPLNPASPITAHDVMVDQLLPNGLELIPAGDPAADSLEEPPAHTGASAPLGPWQSGTGPAAGWSVACLDGPCSAETFGGYLGAEPGPGTGRTRVHFWFGDYSDAADSIYRITVPVRVRSSYAPDSAGLALQVSDGVNEPLWSFGRGHFNLDVTAGAAASGDVFDGFPTSIPQWRDDFDRSHPADRASIDIVTPHLEVAVVARDDNGDEILEVNAGEEISFDITASNTGGRAAYDVRLVAERGVLSGDTRAVLDPATLTLDVYDPNGAGAVVAALDAENDCANSIAGPDPVTGLMSITLTCTVPGPVAGDPDGFSGPLLGHQIRLSYSGRSRPSEELKSPLSALNSDPDVIPTTARASSYAEDPTPTPGGNTYSSDVVRHVVYAYTPLAEIELRCRTQVLSADAGDSFVFEASIGNGDAQDGGGDLTLTPIPRQDLDGDGRVDKGIGYNPHVVVVLPSNVTFTPGSGAVTATGPGPLTDDATYETFGPFPDPDIVTVNPDGTTTLEWTGLDEMPPSRHNHHPATFLPHYKMHIATTVVVPATAFSVGGSLSFEDYSGALQRGEAVGEPWTYTETEWRGCPEDSRGHGVEISPTRDQSSAELDAMRIDRDLSPGQHTELVVDLFSSYDEGLDAVHGSEDDVTGSTFVARIPDGLEYLGTLNPTDPSYQPAYWVTPPAGWPAGTTLQDHLAGVQTDGTGATNVTWDGSAAIAPGSGVMRIPVRALSAPAQPNQWLEITFEWRSDRGFRSVTGEVYTRAATTPQLTKTVDQRYAPFSDPMTGDTVLTYQIEVLVPAGTETHDLRVLELPNGAREFPRGTFQREDVPPLEFVRTVAALTGCVSGCDVADPLDPGFDGIDVVELPPQPFVDYGDAPQALHGGTNPFVDYRNNLNNALAWWLGDITEDPQDDRVVRIVYQVRVPSSADVYDIILDRRSGTAWDDHDDIRSNSTYLLDASSVAYSGLTRLKSDSSPSIYWDNNVPGVDPNWWSSGYAAGVTWDEVWFTSNVEHPVVEMVASCGDPVTGRDADVTPSPVGTPNVRCVASVTNLNQVPAIDVEVSTSQAAEFEYGSWNMWQYTTPALSQAYSGDVGTPLFGSGAEWLTTPAATLPARWLVELAGGETVELAYETRLDGWSNMPGTGVGTGWSQRGGVLRGAVDLLPWRAASGGSTFGSADQQETFVRFVEPDLTASHFPAPPARRLPRDQAPFAGYGEEHLPGAGFPQSQVSAQYFRSLPGGYQYPASGAYLPPQLAGDPWGRFWMGDNYGNFDPLMPLGRNWGWVAPFLSLRYSPNFFRPLIPNCAGWRRCYPTLDPDDPDSTGWMLALDEGENWSEVFHAVPGEPYTWAINLRLDHMGMIDDVRLEETLPYGWSYVPGSTRVVEGDHLLMRRGGTHTFEGYPLTPAYRRIPLDAAAEPSTLAGVATGCAPTSYSGGGQTVVWDFARQTEGRNQIWEHRYVDARDMYNGVPPTQPHHMAPGDWGAWNWIRVEFQAIPDPAVLACDPDVTDPTPFMMEGSLRAVATHNPHLDLGDTVRTFDMLAPVAAPVALRTTPDAEAVLDGTQTRFNLELTNRLPVALTDLDLVDVIDVVVPAGATTPIGPGFQCGDAGAITFRSTEAGGAGDVRVAGCDDTSDPDRVTLTFRLDRVEPGEMVTIEIPLMVVVDERSGTRWDTTATATVKEWHDYVLADAGSITVTNPSPAPQPTLIGPSSPVTINSEAHYDLTWTAEPSQLFMDLLYVHEVPDGLNVVRYGDVTCTGVCPENFEPDDVVALPPVPQPDGTTRLAWYFGDVPGAPGQQVWKLRVHFEVENAYTTGAAVADGDQLLSTAIGYSNDHDEGDTTPAAIPIDPAADSTYVSAAAHQSLDVAEPALVVEKTVVNPQAPAAADGSSVLEYRVTVRNPSDYPAYSVTVTDTPNELLENVEIGDIEYYENGTLNPTLSSGCSPPMDGPPSILKSAGSSPSSPEVITSRSRQRPKFETTSSTMASSRPIGPRSRATEPTAEPSPTRATGPMETTPAPRPSSCSWRRSSTSKPLSTGVWTNSPSWMLRQSSRGASR